MTPLVRFQGKFIIEPFGGCWNWQAGLDSDGYGRFWIEGKTIMAHRASYEFFIGKIPEGLQIDHLCKNRLCVNPSHIEAVTALVNYLRGDGRLHNKKKTECKLGHSYDKDNTYWYENRRQCNQCRRTRALDRYYLLKNK